MSLSLSAQKEIYLTETGDYPIILITITHSDLEDPIRISSDPTQRLESLTTDQEIIYGTIHLGNEYVFFPAEISWPSEEEGSPPQTQITVVNIGRELVSTLRTIDGSPSLALRLILAGSPNQIEGEYSDFKLTDVDIGTLTIKGSLMIDTGANEPFPYITFTPSTAPGLFKI